jgi:hypothetical protein
MLTVLQNGNIGVGGTTTPAANFSILGTSTQPIAFLVASSTGASMFNVDRLGRVGIGTTTPSARLAIAPSAGEIAFLVASSSGAPAFVVNSAGYVSIGTTTPVSATTTVPLRVAGDVRIGSSGTNGCIQGNGGATLTGTCISDQRLKTNINDITNVLDRLTSLRVVNFNWNQTANDVFGNDMNSINTGFVAQNVQSLFPELTTENQQGFTEVNYSALQLYAIQGVKELTERVDTSSSTLVTIANQMTADIATASSSLATLFSNLNTVDQSLQGVSSSLTSALAVFNASTTDIQSQINILNQSLGTINSLDGLITISSTGNVSVEEGGTGGEVLRVAGRVRATGFDIDTAADLAEKFEAEEALPVGTVVAFSTSTVEWSIGNSTSTDDVYSMNKVRRAYDSFEAVGIVSTNPGIVLGKDVPNGVPVAFQGRVPVKVTTENGQIKRGDYITVSKTMPGYAMKLTGDGKALGRALSDYTEGRDKVLVLVENSFQKLDMEGKTATTTGMLTAGNIDLNANGVAIVNVKSIASANGTWSIDENGRIVAKVLCLEDVCIDKTTLTNILNISGQNPLTLGTSTTETSSSSASSTNSQTEENATSSQNNSTTTEEITSPVTEPANVEENQQISLPEELPVVTPPPEESPTEVVNP